MSILGGCILSKLVKSFEEFQMGDALIDGGFATGLQVEIGEGGGDVRDGILIIDCVRRRWCIIRWSMETSLLRSLASDGLRLKHDDCYCGLSLVIK